MKNVDCIIVGSGLAGITLAWELYKRNISFVIISRPSLSKSSLIAPGIWNPIVFKRITPTWQASVLIQYLIDFYRQVEKILNVQLLSPMEIWHVLNHTNEENLWKQKQDLYPKYLKDISYITLKHSRFTDNLKAGIVDGCGRLNTSEYIYYSLQFFQTKNLYTNTVFNYDALIFNHSNSIEYEDIVAEKIIFCEGHLIKNNPWFPFIKLQAAKGEILEIETDEPILPPNAILHKNISIIPNGNNKYLIGSNYDWNDLNELSTEKTKSFFLSIFESIFNIKYQVIGHYAGIRPAADRRPIIGQHPEIKNIFILNGLGTKGVMLAPYCANILAEHILNNKPLDKKISVLRYFN